LYGTTEARTYLVNRHLVLYDTT